jgi:putative mRNA 3-end processing factor
MLFDPLESDPDVADLFISHAHYDHARGFEFPIQRKHSTRETLEIFESDTNRKAANWQEVRRGRRLRLGDVEIEAHDAGHVLGSVQYEIITPDSNVVYASHINFTDTLLTRAAEVAPCDFLVLEATYPASSWSRPRESAVADIVKWALECLRDHRIPAFETDSIGRAQELTRIFNLWTGVPVIVHPRIARINKVYESNGLGLKYLDVSSEEALKTIEESQCVVIVPRRFDVAGYGNFRSAYVSGWSGSLRDSNREMFVLEDQANLQDLLRFVEEAKPKYVSVFHGASNVFAEMIAKRLGIQTTQLVTEPSRKKSQAVKLDEKHLSALQDAFTNFIQTPGFTYEKRDLTALGLREGFKTSEIEEALARLTKNGVLKYSPATDGYMIA